MLYRKTCSKTIFIGHTQSLQNVILDFKKKLYRVPTRFFLKNPSIFPGFSNDTLKKNKGFTPMKLNKSQNISCNNSDIIISKLNLTNLTKAAKPEKHPFFSVMPFVPFLVFLSFPSLLSFIRNFYELPGHVYLIPNLLLYHKQMQLAFQEHLM